MVKIRIIKKEKKKERKKKKVKKYILSSFGIVLQRLVKLAC